MTRKGTSSLEKGRRKVRAQPEMEDAKFACDDIKLI